MNSLLCKVYVRIRTYWPIFDLMLFGFCRELSDLSQVIAKRINLSETLSFFPNEGQLTYMQILLEQNVI